MIADRIGGLWCLLTHLGRIDNGAWRCLCCHRAQAFDGRRFDQRTHSRPPGDDDRRDLGHFTDALTSRRDERIADLRRIVAGLHENTDGLPIHDESFGVRLGHLRAALSAVDSRAATGETREEETDG